MELVGSAGANVAISLLSRSQHVEHVGVALVHFCTYIATYIYTHVSIDV